MQQTILTLLALILAATSALAEPPHTRQLPAGAESPPAALADLAWLAGHWRGEALGGVAEEVWAAPAGGAMMGMFRLVSADKVDFYEMMIIRQVGPSLVLQLKHFHGDLKGWEERDETVDLPLVELTEDAAVFAGLTIERHGEDKLEVWVLFDAASGQEGRFAYERLE